MSWDVVVQNYRGHPPGDDELEMEGEPLGTAAAIRKRIDAHLPGIAWSDPFHAVYESKDFSIEFDLGTEKPISAILLNVRGGGDAFGALKAFAIPNKWSLFDCSESTFLDLEQPTAEAFEEFQTYRDRALRDFRAKKPAPPKKGKKPTPKGPAKAKAKRKPKAG